MTAKAPSKKTLDMVWARDNGCCAWCGDPVSGERGVAWSLHHRVPRSAGGTKRDWVNLPGNLVLLHGSGTTGCHFTVESQREGAIEDGFLVSAIGIMLSSEVPIVHAVHGRVRLLDDGTVTRCNS